MLPPATWYPDPSGRHEHRYWDGHRWTEHVADAGIADVDPLTAVTADEQVDGGVAADIAAVAMASTSTVGDVAPERRAEIGDADGLVGWAPAPGHAGNVDGSRVADDGPPADDLEHLVDDVLGDIAHDEVAADVPGSDEQAQVEAGSLLGDIDEPDLADLDEVAAHDDSDALGSDEPQEDEDEPALALFDDIDSDDIDPLGSDDTDEAGSGDIDVVGSDESASADGRVEHDDDHARGLLDDAPAPVDGDDVATGDGAGPHAGLPGSDPAIDHGAVLAPIGPRSPGPSGAGHGTSPVAPDATDGASDEPDVAAAEDDVEHDAGDDRDAWAAASAVFVMPPDTVADLRRSLHHPEPPSAELPSIARPTFTGVDGVIRTPNIAGGLGHRGATLRLVLDGDTDALVAPAAMRRVDGSIELSPTTSSWADHLTGTGTVELAGSSDVVVVGLAGTQRATLAIEAVLALDAAATIEIAMVDGAWEWALVAVEGATWMALVAGDEPAIVEVTSDDGPVTVDQHDVVGWTDGLVVTVADDDLTAEGDGHLLVRAPND